MTTAAPAPPGNTGVASIRGVDLAWQRATPETAADPPLVWAHGLHGSRTRDDRHGHLRWGELSTGRMVVRYDARGHGRSGYTDAVDCYAWDEMARDQLALTTELGIDRYVAAGASLGAATALWAAVLAPERIAGLVLVIPPTGWETRAAQQDTYAKTASFIERRGIDALVAAAKELPMPDPYRDMPDRWAAQAEALRDEDLTRLVGRFRGATVANLPDRDAVRTVTAPTLILAWSGDPAHPVSSAEQLHDLLPSSTLSVAEVAADVDTWTAALDEYLRSVSEESPS